LNSENIPKSFHYSTYFSSVLFYIFTLFNLVFLHIFHILSQFNSRFFHIFHIFSLFNLP
jgi:hypothetical protein